MPQIVAVRTKDDSSRDSIAVVLSQDAVCLGPDGQPWSGVSLSAQLARSLAARLLDLAKEIEDQDQKHALEPRYLVPITSILVLHDGSLQGVRAFSLALDMAFRSNACIKLVGIYGVRQDKCEPSQASEDYIWLRAWLERLFSMYELQAEERKIDLQTTLIAATDQRDVSEIFGQGVFDLVVAPKRFSEDSAGSEGFGHLHRALAGAAKSNILFCS